MKNRERRKGRKTNPRHGPKRPRRRWFTENLSVVLVLLGMVLVVVWVVLHALGYIHGHGR